MRGAFRGRKVMRGYTIELAWGTFSDQEFNRGEKKKIGDDWERSQGEGEVEEEMGALGRNDLVKERGEKFKQVAQGQYVVSDTRCPALSDCELE